jgi:hypothetical protein
VRLNASGSERGYVLDSEGGCNGCSAAERVERLSDRDAGSEYQHHAIRVTTRNVARGIEHSGLQHRFISPKEVEYGELRDRDYRILMLPWAIALSSREAKRISDFVEYGGTSWPMASQAAALGGVCRPRNERGNELFLWQRKGDLNELWRRRRP